MAPVQRGAQGPMARRRVAPRGAQHTQAVGRPGAVFQQLHGRKPAGHCGRHTRRRHGQRAQPVEAFAIDPERLLRTRQHADPVRGRQRRLNPRGHVGGQMFAVVQHQQQVSWGQRPRQCRRRVAVVQVQTCRGRDRRRDLVCRRERCQVDPPDAVGIRRDAGPRHGLRDAGLADAAGARHGDQAVLAEPLRQRRDVPLPTKQVVDGRRHVGPCHERRRRRGLCGGCSVVAVDGHRKPMAQTRNRGDRLRADELAQARHLHRPPDRQTARPANASPVPGGSIGRGRACARPLRVDPPKGLP